MLQEKKAADFYNKAFADHDKIQAPVQASFANHVYHQYTLILDGGS